MAFFRRDITRRDVAGLAAGAVALGAGLTLPSAARAATFQASDRRCATCDFWGGQRTAAADKSGVSAADGATGICNNPQSPLYNRQARADQVFNGGYRRWRELG
jgi:hypothetical protein